MTTVRVDHAGCGAYGAGMSFKRALFLIIAVVALLVGSSATAGAQDNPDYTAPAPTVEVTSPAPQSLRSTPARAAAGAPLAVTGTDALQLLVVGGLLVAGGAAILTARRRAVS